MNNRHHHRPWRHSNNHAQNRQAPPPPQPPGSVVFRMLCPVDVAGYIIGPSGVIIKQLQAQTGCKINFEQSLPGCDERVVNITGGGAVDRNIIKMWGDRGECLEMEVSTAQMGLMMVFERVSKPQRGESCCRLLAGLGQVGGVMGKGGMIVTEIQQNSGASIQVLTKEQTPSCAAPYEELIQIVGDVMAVKQALVAVSHCLQVGVPNERKGSHLPHQMEFRDRHAGFHEEYNPISPSISGSSTVGSTLSEDKESILRLDKVTGQKWVVFRLLCSNYCAGGVIGKGASVVNKIQDETGAYIKFSSPAAGLKERVATISSLENQESLHSSAQNAMVLVFAKCVEVEITNRQLIDLASVNARILVTLDEINYLVDNRGRIAPDISISLSVAIELLETSCINDCTIGSRKVVQIVGEYEKVKSALFQVTGKLRNKLFSKNAIGEAGLGQQSNSTLPINDLGEVQDPRPKLPHELFKKVEKTRNLEVSAQCLSEDPIGPTSVDAEATMIVELFVPEKSFANVYGENGDNLTRMREISGAKVVVEDPSGGNDGKVIISGTWECILIAQSLLRAFIW